MNGGIAKDALVNLLIGVLIFIGVFLPTFQAVEFAPTGRYWKLIPLAHSNKGIMAENIETTFADRRLDRCFCYCLQFAP